MKFLLCDMVTMGSISTGRRQQALATQSVTENTAPIKTTPSNVRLEELGLDSTMVTRSFPNGGIDQDNFLENLGRMNSSNRAFFASVIEIYQETNGDMPGLLERFSISMSDPDQQIPDIFRSLAGEIITERLSPDSPDSILVLVGNFFSRPEMRELTEAAIFRLYGGHIGPEDFNNILCGDLTSLERLRGTSLTPQETSGIQETIPERRDRAVRTGDSDLLEQTNQLNRGIIDFAKKAKDTGRDGNWDKIIERGNYFNGTIKTAIDTLDNGSKKLDFFARRIITSKNPDELVRHNELRIKNLNQTIKQAREAKKAQEEEQKAKLEATDTEKKIMRNNIFSRLSNTISYAIRESIAKLKAEASV